MLQQSNERIDEIFREAQAGLQDSMEEKRKRESESNGCGCFVALVMLFIGALSNSIELMCTFIVIAIASVFSSSKEDVSVRNGGKSDPDYYMPYIMRMVGEILSDEWGEYNYSKTGATVTVSFLSANVSHPGDGSDQSRRNPRIIEFYRCYTHDAEDGTTDIRDYTVFLVHPLNKHIRMNIRLPDWPFDPESDASALNSITSLYFEDAQRRVYDDVKRNMNRKLGTFGRPAKLDKDTDGWAITYSMKNLPEHDLFCFPGIENHNPATWFEYAHTLAECTKKIAEQMECVMDEAQRNLPSLMLRGYK